MAHVAVEGTAVKNPMKNKKYIIFDFDGTIANTIPVMRTIAQKIVEEGKPGMKITEEDWEWVRNHKLMDFPKKFDIPLFRIPGLLLQGREIMKKLIYSVEPCKGIEEAINELKAKGYSCAILSSTNRDTIQEFLLQHSLVDLFDFVHSELNLFGKSAALTSLMKQYKMPQEKVVYVGDEIRDLGACQKIKLDCISVTWGLSSPEAFKKNEAQYIIDKPEQLITLLS